MSCQWLHCVEPARTKGVCNRHYSRTLRAGDRAVSGAPVADILATIARSDQTPQRERLEDLAWLLDMGEWPPRAARRCGWTVPGAINAAYAYDRSDLANRVRMEVT